jgi:hypothetical protein
VVLERSQTLELTADFWVEQVPLKASRLPLGHACLSIRSLILHPQKSRAHPRRDYLLILKPQQSRSNPGLMRKITISFIVHTPALARPCVNGKGYCLKLLSG